jgi:hypothetical protein
MPDAPPDNGAAAEPEGASLREIPESLEIDPLLAALLHCAAFLDLSTEDEVDPTLGTDVLENVGLYVQRLSPERQDEVAEQLERLRRHAESAGWPESHIEFVEEFLYSCGIGEDIEDE